MQEGQEVYFSGVASRDDVGITEYQWDIGGDGSYELNGSVVSWRFLIPGEYIVTLRILDSWGNAAQDRVNVTVVRADAPPLPEGASVQWVLVAIGVLAAAPMILAIVIRRRKR